VPRKEGLMSLAEGRHIFQERLEAGTQSLSAMISVPSTCQPSTINPRILQNLSNGDLSMGVGSSVALQSSRPPVTSPPQGDRSRGQSPQSHFEQPSEPSESYFEQAYYLPTRAATPGSPTSPRQDSQRRALSSSPPGGKPKPKRLKS
jgi:hypothetical protein